MGNEGLIREVGRAILTDKTDDEILNTYSISISDLSKFRTLIDDPFIKEKFISDNEKALDFVEKFIEIT